MNKPLLQIVDIHVNYGNYKVLEGIDMEIPSGEVICLLGKNGTGKSTLLKSIAGLIPIESGEILFEEQPITNLKTQDRIHLGIGYLMQHRAIFPRLTVADHILLAAQSNNKQPLAEIWGCIEQEFPELIDYKYQISGRLSGGQSRLLSFAMLVAKGADKLWLLDEPSAGIAKTLLGKIGDFLQTYLEKNEITCLLVEQNIGFAKKLSTNMITMQNKNLLTFK